MALWDFLSAALFVSHAICGVLRPVAQFAMSIAYIELSENHGSPFLWVIWITRTLIKISPGLTEIKSSDESPSVCVSVHVCVINCRLG